MTFIDDDGIEQFTDDDIANEFYAEVQTFNANHGGYFDAYEEFCASLSIDPNENESWQLFIEHNKRLGREWKNGGWHGGDTDAA